MAGGGRATLKRVVLVSWLVASCASFDERAASRIDAGAVDGGHRKEAGPADATGIVDGAAQPDVRAAHDAAPDASPVVDAGSPEWITQVSGVFSDDLNAIWGSGAGDVYAGGGTGSLVHSAGGGVWQSVAVQFGVGDVYGIWGASASLVYAVTDDGYVCAAADAGPFLCGTVAEALTAVWGPGGGATYYYLVSDTGVITRVTGPTSQVAEESAGGGVGFFGIWGSSAVDVYAAADNGQIFHSAGHGDWTPESGGQTGAGGTLWGSSASDVYAAGGTVLYHSTGDGIWHVEATPTPVTVTLSGVWGSSASDVYVVGDQGTVLHRTAVGGPFVPELTASSSNLYAVWGSGPNDVYAVGSGGAILHRSPMLP